jgi:(1->4)-alpha-D-glucan 1-alpha-D-glucosylmutase
MQLARKPSDMKEDMTPTLRIPVATYRLQFNRLFRFADALRIVAYLADLGVTDIYSSPYLKAKKGSLHGYDIVDHSSLNPEIGTEEEYNNFIDELKKYDMGQILDIVPNHMCLVSKENLWWMDVLENGPCSRHAHFFDIDWEPVKKELKNKVLLPFLGDQYGTVLENRELRLFFETGALFIAYYDNIFPIEPKTYPIVLEYRIEELKEVLGEGDLTYMEFVSILTSLKNLPSCLEVVLERIDERYR